MKKKIFQKLIDKAYELRPMVNHGRNIHFTFLVRNSRIITVGWNNPNKTHPFPAKVGYEYPYIHSEYACLKIASVMTRANFSRCFLVNIRIDKTGKINLSKPCKNCRNLICFFGVTKVYYSNSLGEFDES